MSTRAEPFQLMTGLVTIESTDIPAAPHMWPPESVAYEELKHHVKRRGLVVPIFVRKQARNSQRYLIVSGHYRFQAAVELGFKHIPCVEITNIAQAAIWLHDKGARSDKDNQSA